MAVRTSFPDGADPIAGILCRFQLRVEASYFFVRLNQFWAQRFDPGKGVLIDEAVPIADGLSNGSSYSISENGIVVFRRAAASIDNLRGSTGRASHWRQLEMPAT